MMYSPGRKLNPRSNKGFEEKGRFSTILSLASALFQLLFRIVVVVVVIVLIVLIYVRSSSDDYFLQSLSVPPSFTARGFDGNVVSMKILDELTAIQNNTITSKVSNRVSSRESQDDVSVQMMGIGLSINAVVGYIEGLFGKKKRTISGEITEENGVLTMTLRFTDSTPKVFRIASDDAVFSDEIRVLTANAANEILKKTDPYYVAIYYIYSREYDKCIKMCRQIISSGHKDSNWAYLLWTDILITQDRYAECLAVLDRAIDEYPEFFPLRERKFSCLRKMGEWDRAYNELMAGFDTAEESDLMHVILIECLVVIGDESVTARHIAEMKRKYPDSFYTRKILANQAWRLERFDSALWYADQALFAAGSDHRLLNKAAEGYFAIGRPEKGLEVADILFELDSSVLAWDVARESYEQLGRYDLALKCSKVMFDRSAKNAPDHYRYAESLIDANDLTGAKAHLMRAVDLDPEFYLSYQRLSEIFDREDNRRESEKYIRLYYNASPRASDDRLALANHFRQWNQLDSATIYFKTCVDRAPTNPDFLNSLAYHYELAGSLDSARKYINRAVLFNPRHGYSYSTLAEIQGLEAKADSFFITLDKAVRYGYPISETDFSIEPYNTYKDDPRMKELMAR